MTMMNDAPEIGEVCVAKGFEIFPTLVSNRKDRFFLFNLNLVRTCQIGHK